MEEIGQEVSKVRHQRRKRSPEERAVLEATVNRQNN